MKAKSALLQSVLLLAVWLMMGGGLQAQFTFMTNDGTLTITAYAGSGGAVVIPSETNGLPVTSIGADAFDNYNYNYKVTGVTIPNGITNIGQNAFAGCANLTNVTIPGSVINFGVGAFNGCQKLRNVTLANGLTSIGTNMFADCGALTSVTIPGTVTSIEQGAFESCGLTNIIVPGSVASIGQQAFSLSYGLSAAYFLGNAPSLGGDAFQVNSMTVYYQPFTTGWSNTYGGYPTAPWIPPLPTLGITTYSNQPVVFFPLTMIGTNFELQMTTNLASSNWVTVTNGLPFIGVQVSNPASPAFFRIQ